MKLVINVTEIKNKAVVNYVVSALSIVKLVRYDQLKAVRSERHYLFGLIAKECVDDVSKSAPSKRQELLSLLTACQARLQSLHERMPELKSFDDRAGESDYTDIIMDMWADMAISIDSVCTDDSIAEYGSILRGQIEFYLRDRFDDCRTQEQAMQKILHDINDLLIDIGIDDDGRWTNSSAASRLQTIGVTVLG
ncbi:MAG: hypothetical protein ABIR91_03950 [Candidatus Saccharimonadales bacterium]